MNQEKSFLTSYLTEDIFRIYKEFSNLNDKETNNANRRMGEKTWTDFSSKKIYE